MLSFHIPIHSHSLKQACFSPIVGRDCCQMTKGRRQLPQIQTEVLHTGKYMSVREKVVVKDVNITCINMGEDASSNIFPPVIWSCDHDHMWPGRTYDLLLITCECYDHCDDDYVWKGSCAIEYTTQFANFWWGLLYWMSPILAIVAIVGLWCCGIWTSEQWSRMKDKRRRMRWKMRQAQVSQEKADKILLPPVAGWMSSKKEPVYANTTVTDV